MAGIVAPIPKAIDSPAEPAVCAILFSRMVASRPPTFAQPRNSASEITATAPAKIFGMYPRKGTIAVGCDADVVVWDPNRAKTLGVDTLHMRVDYSPFEGRQIIGAPSHVLSRGDLVVQDDGWVAKSREGRGRFFKRGTFAL